MRSCGRTPRRDDGGWAAHKNLERGVKELRRANESLKPVSAFFAQAALDQPAGVMYRRVDGHLDHHGVEPVCKVLQIAPSAYRCSAARCSDASLLSARAKREAALQPAIKQVRDANLQACGAGKVRKQLNHERIDVARRTIERLMRRPRPARCRAWQDGAYDRRLPQGAVLAGRGQSAVPLPSGRTRSGAGAVCASA